MKTSRLYLEIVRGIHNTICDEFFLRRSTKRQADFSRRRKIGFTDYMYLTIQNLKSSLQAGLNAFFDAQKDRQIEYSKQAFSKGRKRIKPEAFQELFQRVVENFYEKAELTDWKGYQLFGIDGTRLNLPCTNELAELYGVQTSQGAPQVQALVSCMYDLLNGMAAPYGGRTLAALAAGKKTACIIISDHTRPVPSRDILPQMLRELREGSPEINVTLLVATGCHRGTTKEELRQKLGAIADTEKS